MPYIQNIDLHNNYARTVKVMHYNIALLPKKYPIALLNFFMESYALCYFFLIWDGLAC